MRESERETETEREREMECLYNGIDSVSVVGAACIVGGVSILVCLGGKREGGVAVVVFGMMIK